MIPLDKLKMGYFIVYRHERGIIGDMIIKEQRSRGISPRNARYTHVEVSGGEEYALYTRPPKSKVVDITKAHAGEYVKVMRYKGYNLDKTDRKRLKVAYFSAAQSNLWYDVRGVLSFVLPFIRHSRRLFFCSEGAVRALRQVIRGACGDRPDNEWMPAHFLDPLYFECVHEGYIS